MFDSRSYEVRQKLGIGNKYNVYEGTGDDAEHILSAKQKALKLKEDFRFKDPESGDPRYRVTTDNIIDYKASYTLVDEVEDEIVGAFERQSSGTFRQKWGLFDAEGDQVGLVKEDSLWKAFLRRNVTGLIPVAFNVYDPQKNLSKDGGSDHETIATVDGAFSFRDRYTVDVDSDDIDPRLAVLGAVIVDAIEGN